MKRFLSALLAMCMILSTVAAVVVFAENDEKTIVSEAKIDCHYKLEQKYGSEIELFSANSGSATDRVKGAIQAYMDIRRQSFFTTKKISDVDFLSEEVIDNENDRRRGIVKMEKNMLIDVLDAASKTTFESIKSTTDGYTAYVYEWVYFDYDDLETETEITNVSGMGVDHIIKLEKSGSDFVIVSDEYDEWALTGMYTRSEPRESNPLNDVEELPGEEIDEDEVSLFYDSSYDPDDAVEYSYEYTDNSYGQSSSSYNKDWPNYNSVGGDCANFVSQCLLEGGIDMVQNYCEGSSNDYDDVYCTTCCWYHEDTRYQTTARSATWTGAHYLRAYMSTYKGNRVNKPSSDEVYYGSPVFYDWDSNGHYDHAAICVGEVNGTVVVNSHNNNYVEMKWNYGGSGTTHSTVQMTRTNPQKKPPIGITLDTYELHLSEGDTYTLDAEVYPSDADDSFIWTTDDDDVATVSKSGKVKAVGEGETVITCVAALDYSVTSACKVIVTSPVPVEAVNLDDGYVELDIGDTHQLEATVLPYDASNKELTWKSYNTSVATVSSTGKVTAKAKGDAVIRVASKENSNIYDECTIHVKYYPVTGISLNKYSMTLDLEDNKTETLKATVSPSNASNPDVKWSVPYGSSYVSVSTTGKVTAKAYGQATVRATSVDNPSIYADCSVNVKYVPVERIELNKESLKLEEGDTATLSVRVYPSDATNQEVTWESSNSTYVTVKNGKVTAKKGGSATITVRSADNYYAYDTCFVEVRYDPIEEFSISPTSLNMVAGEKEQIYATITPSYATNQGIIWTSSDKNVATVDKYGKVTAKGKGTAVITATTEDEPNGVPFKATCDVKVTNIAWNLNYYTGELTIRGKGEMDDYAYATDQPWYSDNDRITSVTVEKGITSVGDRAFCQLPNLKRVTLPTTVKTIGDYAFTADTALTSINIDSVKEIGTGAFRNCSNLFTIDFDGALDKVGKEAFHNTKFHNAPSNWTGGALYLGKNLIDTKTSISSYFTVADGTVTIADYAFKNSGATPMSITLSDTVVNVGDYAFTGCSNLRTLTLGKKVKVLGEGVFENLSALKSFEVHKSNSVYYAENGVLYNKKKTDLVKYPEAKAETEFVILDKVKVIKSGAFEGIRYLKTLTLPAALTTIEESAFTGCEALTDIHYMKFDKDWEKVDIGPYNYSLYNADIHYLVKVTGVSFRYSNTSVDIYDTIKLNAVVEPSNATNKAITWKSSSKKIATVDENGYVTGLKEGTATITATTVDGKKKATCKVEVIDNTIHVTGVEMSDTTAEVAIGKSIALDAWVLPYNADIQDIEWKSSSAKVATVDENGVVTGIKEGKATITATSVDGKKKATCKVNVFDDSIHVTEVKLNKAEADMYIYKTLKLNAAVYPTNADVQDIEWKSSSTKVATVDENGVVTALKGGKVTITATSVDGKKKATCKITIIDNSIHVTKVTLPEKTMTVYMGDVFTLNETVEPANATNCDVTWKSSSVKIATVDENGVVTAIKPGSATITVTSVDGGKKATCKLKVLDPTIYATKVTLDKTKATLYVGDEIGLDATVTPDNVTHEGVTWKSSKTSVATVDENGVVTAIKKGSATITATSADGKKKATCKITVK